MEGGSTDQAGVPPATIASHTESTPNRSAPRRVARVLVHPIALAILALAIGSVVGIEGKLGTNSGKPPSGQSAHSNGSNLSDVGLEGARSPSLPPAGMHPTFDATFTGSALDTQVWSTCYWYAVPGAGCGHSGIYDESEWYLPSQDTVSDGALNLVASAVPTTGSDSKGKPKVFPCRSGMVTTDPSFDFTYGYLQVVARMPNGRNTWPALWMLPVDHSTDLPEIDLLEMIGRPTNRPTVAFHPAKGPQRTLIATTADLSSGWHTFGLDWEPGALTWFIDGKAVFTVTTNVPNRPMYLLANLAITNAFLPLQLPGSCAGSLSIRSVEVWQNTAS